MLVGTITTKIDGKHRVSLGQQFSEHFKNEKEVIGYLVGRCFQLYRKSDFQPKLEQRMAAFEADNSLAFDDAGLLERKRNFFGNIYTISFDSSRRLTLPPPVCTALNIDPEKEGMDTPAAVVGGFGYVEIWHREDYKDTVAERTADEVEAEEYRREKLRYKKRALALKEAELEARWEIPDVDDLDLGNCAPGQGPHGSAPTNPPAQDDGPGEEG